MDAFAEYRRKRVRADAAAGLVGPGERIGLGIALAHPPALLEALAARLAAGELRDLTVYYTFALEAAARTILRPELAEQVHARPLFVTGADRRLMEARGSAAVDYVPTYLHQVPRLFAESIPLDSFLTTVSPMDRHGWMSFGASVGYTRAALRRAKRVLVEVNEQMPRVHGDAFVHVSEVDAVVEWSQPLPELPARERRPEDDVIGRAIAAQVPDGATLQLGVGGVPDAVAACLRDRRDLGIHTELFTPGMVDLIESGCVTGARKRTLPGKHAFTIALGDTRTYRFLDDNPAVVGLPCSVTNDPAVIARNPGVVSVNGILEVDLYGQVNAEFLDDHEWSGVGGQHDFVRGAYRSPGGKSFLAFYATAHGGSVSRVVPRLEGPVTDPRMDVHHLVTEHGLVDLKGRSTRERAELIVSIADPRFRDDLLREARHHRLL